MSGTASSHLPASVDPLWRIGIVQSRFHEAEVQGMANSAVQALINAGIAADRIRQYEVSGAFEVPLIGAALARRGAADALIGLGIIVQGETWHADHLARETARGIMEVQIVYGIPFAYEVLHVSSRRQARARAGKGAEAAVSVLHSLALLKGCSLA